MNVRFNVGKEIIVMTQLDCKATECRYNQDKMCCRAGITVEGSSAKQCDDTYCGNFEVGRDGCACNQSGEPDGVTEITCDAKHCHYNKHKKCSAGSVDIVDSNGIGQTKCASFTM